MASLYLLTGYRKEMLWDFKFLELSEFPSYLSMYKAEAGSTKPNCSANSLEIFCCFFFQIIIYVVCLIIFFNLQTLCDCISEAL